MVDYDAAVRRTMRNINKQLVIVERIAAALNSQALAWNAPGPYPIRLRVRPLLGGSAHYRPLHIGTLESIEPGDVVYRLLPPLDPAATPVVVLQTDTPGLPERAVLINDRYYVEAYASWPSPRELLCFTRELPRAVIARSRRLAACLCTRHASGRSRGTP